MLTFVNVLDELGRAARDAAGWHVCLELLAFELSGEEAPWAQRHRWEEVHPSYMEAFGPEASTIGPPTIGPPEAVRRI